MVGLQLNYNEFNLSTDEINGIKKLCNSFGVRPACSIDDETWPLNDEMITFDFGDDIKRKAAFKRGMLRLLRNNTNLGTTERIPDHRRVSCPWVET